MVALAGGGAGLLEQQARAPDALHLAAREDAVPRHDRQARPQLSAAPVSAARRAARLAAALGGEVGHVEGGVERGARVDAQARVEVASVRPFAEPALVVVLRPAHAEAPAGPAATRLRPPITHPT